MSAKSKKKTSIKPAKKPRAKSPKPAGQDDVYDDGDMATPKRDLTEDEIKEQYDNR